MTSIASVSAIIVSYYTGAILLRSIESVLKQANISELILVNNGNNDSTLIELANIAKQDKRFKLLTTHKNIGFAAACNLGADYASSTYLMFINPDCLIENKFNIIDLITGLESEPLAIMAGVKINNSDGSRQITTTRNLPTLDNILFQALGFNKLNLKLADNKKQFVPAISGAFMFLDKQDYLNLGKLDENYFLHFEDLDFCKQIQLQKRKIIYLPNVEITHFLSTSKVSNNFIERQKTISFIKYIKKHFDNSKWLILLILAAKIRLLIKFIINLIHNKPVSNLSYRKFLSDDKTTKKEINNNLALIGVSNQIGLSLLKILINSNINFRSFYHQQIIDIYCNNVEWQRLDLQSNKIDLMKTQVLIYTAPLWLLPGFLIKNKHQINRLICFSSTSIFTKVNSTNSKEKLIIAKLIKAEKQLKNICKDQAINYTILRPTLIYGLGIDQNISKLAKFINKYHFFFIYNNATGLRQPVHAMDLAKAALKIINNPITYNKSYNLVGGEIISYKGMLERIFQVMNLKIRLINNPLLPMILTIIGKLTGSSVNAQLAIRMNKDMIFSSKEAIDDFAYQARGYLSAGLADLTWQQDDSGITN